MESQKNNKGVIILLVVIIIILSVLCVLFATGTVSFNSNNLEDNKTNENSTNNESNDKLPEEENELYKFVGKYISISSDPNSNEYFVLNSDGTANLHFVTGDGKKPYNDITVKYYLITENDKTVLKFDTVYPYWNTLDVEKIDNGYKFIPREVGPSAVDLTFKKNK